MEFSKRRRLLWALRMLAAAPFLIGASIAAFITLLLASMIFRKYSVADGGALLLIIGATLSAIAWLAGGWVISRPTFTREQNLSRYAKLEIGLVIGSTSFYLSAGYMSAPAPLVAVCASLIVLAFGALLWTMVEICTTVWDRTRRARYAKGMRCRPNRVISLGFRTATAIWMAAAVIAIIFGNGSPVARAMDAVATVGAILLIILWEAMLMRVLRDVSDELSVQDQPHMSHGATPVDDANGAEPRLRSD